MTRRRYWLSILMPTAALAAAWLLCIALGAGATAKAFMLFGLGGMMALCAVAEVIERREGRLPEARLLAVAVDSDGLARAVVVDAGRFAPTHVRGMQRPFDVRAVGLWSPHAVGLWVWEGRLLPPLGIDVECMPDVGPEWIGTWRRATPEEAQRFAAGLPVWEESDG